MDDEIRDSSFPFSGMDSDKDEKAAEKKKKKKKKQQKGKKGKLQMNAEWIRDMVI